MKLFVYYSLTDVTIVLPYNFTYKEKYLSQFLFLQFLDVMFKNCNCALLQTFCPYVFCVFICLSRVWYEFGLCICLYFCLSVCL